MNEWKDLSRGALLAGLTALLEGVARPLPESPVRAAALAAVEAVWGWLDAPERPETEAPTVAQAQGMASSRLYRAHVPGLLSLTSTVARNSREYAAIGATYQILCFVVLQIDAAEGAWCPAKPNVLPSDVVEANWESLAEGLSWCRKAAADPVAERTRQQELVQALAADFPNARQPLGAVPRRADLAL